MKTSIIGNYFLSESKSNFILTNLNSSGKRSTCAQQLFSALTNVSSAQSFLSAFARFYPSSVTITEGKVALGCLGSPSAPLHGKTFILLLD